LDHLVPLQLPLGTGKLVNLLFPQLVPVAIGNSSARTQERQPLIPPSSLRCLDAGPRQSETAFHSFSADYSADAEIADAIGTRGGDGREVQA
jgi:hypothetical protein